MRPVRADRHGRRAPREAGGCAHCLGAGAAPIQASPPAGGPCARRGERRRTARVSSAAGAVPRPAAGGCARQRRAPDACLRQCAYCLRAMRSPPARRGRCQSEAPGHVYIATFTEPLPPLPSPQGCCATAQPKGDRPTDGARLGVNGAEWRLARCRAAWSVWLHTAGKRPRHHLAAQPGRTRPHHTSPSRASPPSPTPSPRAARCCGPCRARRGSSGAHSLPRSATLARSPTTAATTPPSSSPRLHTRAPRSRMHPRRRCPLGARPAPSRRSRMHPRPPRPRRRHPTTSACTSGPAPALTATPSAVPRLHHPRTPLACACRRIGTAT